MRLDTEVYAGVRRVYIGAERGLEFRTTCRKRSHENRSFHGGRRPGWRREGVE